MNSNDPKNLRRRIDELIKHWAPRHAQILFAIGARLSDGHGLTWVCNEHPSWRLSDEDAKYLQLYGKLYDSIPWYPEHKIPKVKSDNPYRSDGPADG